MKRLLLDSNTLNHFIYRRAGVYERAESERRGGSGIGTAIPIVAEFLAGLELSASREKNRPIVERELTLLTLWPFDLAAARVYANLHAQLRMKGVRMQPIDLMIAAIAMVIPGCTVISSDGDFSRVPNLRVKNWME